MALVMGPARVGSSSGVSSQDFCVGFSCFSSARLLKACAGSMLKQGVTRLLMDWWAEIARAVLLKVRT